MPLKRDKLSNRGVQFDGFGPDSEDNRKQSSGQFQVVASAVNRIRSPSETEKVGS